MFAPGNIRVQTAECDQVRGVRENGGGSLAGEALDSLSSDGHDQIEFSGLCEYRFEITNKVLRYLREQQGEAPARILGCRFGTGRLTFPA